MARLVLAVFALAGVVMGARVALAASSFAAVLKAKPASVTVGGAVAFDARSSRVPRGDRIASWVLNFGDGTRPLSGRGAPGRYTHAYKKTGTFTAKLSITDLRQHHSTLTTTRIKVTPKPVPKPKPTPTVKPPATTPAAPVTTAPAPVPTQPAPVPTQPAPVPTQPAPVPTQPAPVPTQPAPVPTQPAPVPTQPAPVPTQPAPVPTQPAPVPTQPAPVPTQPAPPVTTPPAPVPTTPAAPTTATPTSAAPTSVAPTSGQPTASASASAKPTGTPTGTPSASPTGGTGGATGTPGPVTGLTVTTVGTAPELSWTNPTTASYTGALVRRSTGTTPPSSPTDGTLVADVAAPGISIDDNTATPGVTYTYAVYAHDTADNYAAPATDTYTPPTMTTPMHECGDITTDTTWDTTTAPGIILDCTLTIDPNVTLTIKPGLWIKAGNNTTVLVDGTLTAAGTGASPVTLTSYRDDSLGGDTNGDGTNSRPAAGDWGGLVQDPYNDGGAHAISLSYVQLNYGQGLHEINSSFSVENTSLSNDSGAAVSDDAGLLGDIFTGNTASGDGFNGVQEDAMGLQASTTVTTAPSWAFQITPYNNDGGDYPNFTVAQGVTLSVTPGSFIKVKQVSIVADGTISIAGTKASPVILTSFRDSSVGGATNGTGPAAGDWGGLVQDPYNDGGAHAISLSYVQLNYGQGLHEINSSFSVENTSLSNDSGAAVSDDAGLLGDIFTGNTASGDGFNGVQEDAMGLQASTTVTTAPSWAFQITPYNNDGGDYPNFTVAQGVTLSVTPGSFIKVKQVSIVADGTISIAGKPTSPVTLTSYRDDSLGGDTNGDGTNSRPAAGDWGGLVQDPYNDGGAHAISLSYVQLNYGQGLHEINSSFSVENTSLSNDSGAAVSDDAGLLGDIFTGNTASGDGFNGVQEDAMGLQASTTVTTAPSWAFQITPYNNDGGDYPNFTVAQGVTLSVTPGSFIKVKQVSIVADGTISIAGTKASPVILTSFRDSSVGGATNGTGPAAGDWGGLVQDPYNDGGAHAISLSYVQLNYGQGLHEINSSFSVENTSLSNDSGAAVSDDAGLLGDIFTGNTASGDGFNGVQEDAMGLQASTTVTTAPSWAFQITPYNNDGGDYPNFTVAQGVTLSVTPGSFIKVKQVSIVADGTISIAGKPTSPVTLTSYRDDSLGGDTNGDGTNSRPAAGDWGGLVQDPYNDGGAHAISLSYVQLNYGQGLHEINSSFSVENTSLSNDSGAAVSDDAGLLGDIFTGNTASGDGFNGVQEDAMGLQASTTVTTAPSWAFQITPYNNDGGDYPNFTVAQGVTLSVTPGSFIKVKQVSIVADGTISIAGKPTSPVTLTSYRDDSLGGDTNGDGTNSRPAAGDWGGLVQDPYNDGGAHAISLSYVQLNYGQGLHEINSSFSVENTSLSNDSGAAVSDDAGLLGDIFTGNTASGDGFNGVQEDAMGLQASTTVTTAPSWAFQITPYNNDGGDYPNFTVAQGVTLSVTPGSFIKVKQVSIVADGTISIAGTKASPVILTSFRDSSVGGATNGTGPAAGDWGGLVQDPYNDGGAHAISLSYVQLNYAQAGLDVQTSAPVTNSSLVGDGVGVVGPSPAGDGSCPAVVDASNDFWGDLSGPAPFGSGAGVSGCVSVQPWVGETQSQARYFGSGYSGGAGGSGSYTNTHGRAGDPVDVVSGDFTLSVTDVGVSGVGPGLSSARSYDATSASSGLLGAGWSSSWETHLVPSSDVGTADVHWGDGRVDAYTPNSDGTFTAQAGNFATLTATGTGSSRVYTVTTKDRVYSFTAAGALSSVADSNGNTVTVTSDSSGRPVVVTDGAGRKLQFAYGTSGGAAGRLVSVTDPAGKVWSYGYSTAGDLVSVTDPTGAVVGYGYDSAHRIVSATDADGNVVLTNSYDINSRVTRQVDAAGGVTSFAWTDNGDRTGSVTKTDPLGNVRVYAHNAAGQLVSVRDGLGQTTTYTYDTAGDQTSVTDPLGRVTTRTFDSDGNVLTSTDAAGDKTITSYTSDLPVKVVDPAGATSTLAYDGKRNVVSRTDALGNTTGYTVNNQGLVTKTTDPLGRVTTTAYDAAGNPTSVTDPLGRVTARTYDSDGRVLTVTDPLGGVTSEAYDARGDLVKVTDPLNRVISSVFDPAGHVTQVTDPAGKATSSTFTPTGLVASVTDADGRTTSSGYDADGNLTSVTDPTGAVTSYGYDAGNRRTSASDAAWGKTVTGYDAAGQVTSVTDPDGHATTTAYDNAGRVSSVTDPDGDVVGYGYDADGRRTKSTDADGHVTTTTYDADGHVTATKDPLGRTTGTVFDADGRPTKFTDQAGGITTRTFDADGELTGVTYPDSTTVADSYDGDGRLTGRTDRAGTLEQTFDADDELTKTVDGLGQTVAWGYDPDGRTGSRTAAGTTTTFGYTAAGRLTGVTDTAGNAAYTRDTAGDLTGASLPGGITLAVTLDAAHRPTDLKYTQTTGTGASATTATVFEEQAGYDAAGNVTTVTDPTGTHTYTYDPAHRLTADQNTPATGTTGTSGSTTGYAYDAVGNRTKTTSTPAGGTATSTTAAYDADDELTTQTTGSATTGTYSYTALGQRSSQTVGTGASAATTSYAYDGAGHLKTSTTGGTSTAYTTDDGGTLLQVGSTKLLYDRTAPGLLLASGTTRYLTSPSSPATPGSTPSYASVTGSTLNTLSTDLLGSVRGRTAGTTTTSTGYDAYGTPTTSTGTTGSGGTGTTPRLDLGYTGGLTLPGGQTQLEARAYDPTTAGWTTADPAGIHEGNGIDSLTAYTGDNPATSTDPTGLLSLGSVYRSATKSVSRAYNSTENKIGNFFATNPVGKVIQSAYNAVFANHATASPPGTASQDAGGGGGGGGGGGYGGGSPSSSASTIVPNPSAVNSAYAQDQRDLQQLNQEAPGLSCVASNQVNGYDGETQTLQSGADFASDQIPAPGIPGYSQYEEAKHGESFFSRLFGAANSLQSC